MNTRSRRSTSNRFHIESLSKEECGVFNIVEVGRDGDCLFSSIWHFLKGNEDHFKEVPLDAYQVRAKIVDYMLARNSIGFQNNWDRFYGNIKFNLESRIAGLAKYGENDKKDKAIIASYRKYMMKAGHFGTNSELCAAAELFGFSGYIFQRNDFNKYCCYEFGTGDSEIDRTKPILFLLFTGLIDLGHFRPLESLTTPTYVQLGDYILVDSSIPTSNDSTIIIIKKCQGNNLNQKPPVNESVPLVSSTQTFECDVCKQSFKSQRGLKIHRNRHVKEANTSTVNVLHERLKVPTEKDNPSNNRKKDSSKTELDSDCKKWQVIFEDFEKNENFDETSFDQNVENFQKFLFEANQRLPGPIHPSVKFYRLRRKQKNRKLTSSQQSRSSNPQRTDAKAKQRRRDQYQYDLTQYWYYNQRKKAVRSVMSTGVTNYCKIKMGIMEEHFKKVFESENNNIRISYPNTEIHPNVFVDEEVVRKQIRKIPLDTSAGPDQILVKTLRQLNVAKSITSIANTMLQTSYVPHGFRNGKLILLDKYGDVNSVSNWRPITIYSVIRRIIEKALDVILRSQVSINQNQRGFVSGIAGCHINARLINACLQNAKKYKKNCVSTFLDVSKAFDKVGHLHISKSLKSKGVSNNLHDLIMNLLTNNYVEISMGKDVSNPIKVNCGVPQGGPLSPFLFNIAIDFLYEEICDSQYANHNGYNLSNGFDALCLTGFADDQAVTSHSEESAIRTIELIQDIFMEIGLEINPSKSQTIIIRNGILVDGALHLSNGSEITGINLNDRIKYLGCSFNSEIVFDHSCIEKLNKNLHQLSTSPLLKPDQKLNILNQYIFPILVYPLQTAPLYKIPSYVTDGLDIMIRRTVKEIIGIPMRTNDNFFYSPRKLRGLGLFRASWEVFLQHFSIADKLSNINDGLFQSISKCTEEMNACVLALNVVGDTSKALRSALRYESFKNWCNLKYQGSGVIHFEKHTPSNDFIYNKNSLSSSEWVAAIKLSCNYANLNGVPGVDSSSNLCRKCNKESETIAHVTGSCESNKLLITSRHHGIKHQIAELLRAKSWICFDEVYAIDTDGRSRFSDIIAFPPNSNKAYIIDPTIRYEINDIHQDKMITKEKEDIYNKCIQFYKDKYSDSFGVRNWSVRGLWFGSRGTISDSAINFFREFKLDISILKKFSEEILSKTIHIINNHI